MAALPLTCKVSACIRFCFLARLGLAFPLPSWRCPDFDFSNRRDWFYEQGHRGFKGEKGEPGLPGLDGLDAPCPLVWHFPCLRGQSGLPHVCGVYPRAS